MCRRILHVGQVHACMEVDSVEIEAPKRSIQECGERESREQKGNGEGVSEQNRKKEWE